MGRIRRLHERGDGSRAAKNNAGRIRNHDGPVFLLAPDTVCYPQRAVNGGNERLNPVALMTVNIADNLREVEDLLHGASGLPERLLPVHW